MKNKKRWIVITIICILIIASIVTTVLVLNNKNQKNNSNEPSTTEYNKPTEQNENLDNKNDNSQDNKENNDEKEDSNLDNQENSKTADTKKEDEKKNTNTKSNSSSRNNSTNNNNNTQPTQQPKPQETTPVVTETKYYAQCSLGSLESGKQLTESQIKAKYPVGESRTLGQGTLHSDLDKIAPQTGLSRDAFDAYQGACKWISKDNKNTLGYTMIVHIAITNNFEKWKDINIDLYNNYKNAYNNLAYKNWDSSHRIIGEYYLNNHQWNWNPNNLHF